MAYANFEGFEWLAADIKDWVQTKAKITATGATEARTLSERFADVINVKDFGAIGDGITDDTNAIQSAIAAAGDNDIVFLPANSEFMVSTITINKEITLRGGKIKSNGTAITINIPTYEKGTFIEGIEINAGEIGINNVNGGGINITNCEISGAVQYGIYSAAFNEVYINNTRITINDDTNTGIGIYMGSSDSLISNTLIKGYKTAIYDAASCRLVNVHGWTTTTPTLQFLTDSTFLSTNGRTILVSCVADSYNVAVDIRSSAARIEIFGLIDIHSSQYWVNGLTSEIFRLEDGVAFSENLLKIFGLINQTNGVSEQFINISDNFYIKNFYANNILSYITTQKPVDTEFIRGSIHSGSYTSLLFLEDVTNLTGAYVRCGEDANAYPYLELCSKALNGATATTLTLSNGLCKTSNTIVPATTYANLGSQNSAFGKIFGNAIYSASIYGVASAISEAEIDVSAGDVFTKTITENTAFTITGTPAGRTANFSLIITNGGAYNITWPSSVKWAGGAAPTLSASGVDVLSFVTPNGGNTWYATLDIAAAA